LRRRAARAKSKFKNLRESKPVESEGFKQNNNDANTALGVHKRNCYTLDVPFSPQVGVCTFFAGHLAMMPRHFAEAMDEYMEDHGDFNVGFKSASNAFYKKISWASLSKTCVVLHEEDVDLVFFEVAEMDMHRNITSLFVSDKDLVLTLNKLWGVVPHLRTDERSGIVSIEHKPAIMFQLSNKTYKDPEGVYYRAPTAFATEVCLGKGWCGNLYWTADSTKTESRICGMHVAGNDHYGYAILVTKEMLAEVSEHFSQCEGFYLADDVEYKGEAYETFTHSYLNPNFRPLCFAPTIRAKTKIDISHSVLADASVEVMDPKMVVPKVNPHFVDGKLVHPLDSYHSKMGNNGKPVDTDAWQASVDAYTSIVVEALSVNGTIKRSLTFEEAVVGIPGIMEGIPLDTSAGYRFGDDKPGGKRYWFAKDGGGYDLTKPEALEMKTEVDVIYDKCKRGVRPMLPYKDCVKVERRKVGKAARGINACPLPMTILFRMLFGGFMIAFTAARFSVGSLLGINVHGEEWDILAKRLGPDGIIAGDFSGWDGSLTSYMLSSMFKLLEVFYAGCSDEELLVRRMLWLELSNPRHVTNVLTEEPPPAFVPDYAIEVIIVSGKKVWSVTIIYEVSGAMPSGHPFTTQGNIIVNNLGQAYVISKAAEINLSDAHKFFEKFDFGDDNLIAVPAVFRPLVTHEKLVVEYDKIGLVYTDEDKTGAVIQHKLRETASILKRGIKLIKRAGRYVAPLELSVIMEMILWRSLPEQPGAAMQNVQTAFFELSYHGEKVFDKVTSGWMPYLVREGLVPSISSWSACLAAALKLETAHL
jgi:hypothetical protein